MRYATANRAHVADLHIADVRCCFGQQRALGAEQGRVLDLVMGGHGADADRAFVPGDAAETGDAAQVDETLGRGQPQLHHGDEAHAAGDGLGAAGKQVQRLVERFRSGVFEFLRNHFCGSSQFFVASSFQIFSGVSGMSM